MNKSKLIKGGLYLVLEPSVEKNILFQKLNAALEGGVRILQIWNYWPEGFDRPQKATLIREVVDMAAPFDVPVLINEEWELLEEGGLAGVHFDKIPADFAAIKKAIPEEAIVGVTCGNDLRVVEWADQQGLDYISFCAMFPSSSAGECEIVSVQTVQRASAITDLPLFVSGGVTPDNLLELKALDIAGVAVISGILNHEHPKEAALTYNQLLKKLEDEKFTAQ